MESQSFVIMLRPAPAYGKEGSDETVSEHFEYLKSLRSEGTLIMAGRFSEVLIGLVILETKGEDEAREILEPYLVRGGTPPPQHAPDPQRRAQKEAFIKSKGQAIGAFTSSSNPERDKQARKLFGAQFDKENVRPPALLERRVGAGLTKEGETHHTFNKETNRWEIDPTGGMVPVSEEFANRNKRRGQPRSPAAHQGDPAWLDAAMTVALADFKMPEGLRPEQLQQIQTIHPVLLYSQV